MFHALLIGIDYYFPNQLSNGGRYRSLAGCVNDIEHVEAMLRQRLRALDAAGELQIRTLIAPNHRGQPGGDPAQWPTAARIRAALAQVEAHAQPGDQVYLHYAGHGGRVTTLWPQIKGDHGEDEALVPMDIGEPAGTFADRYLRDVELARFLDRLAAKREVLTTLVFDSCHAGGATRSAQPIERVAMRCATHDHPSHAPSDTLDRSTAISHELDPDALRAMAEAWQRLRGSERTAMPARTPKLPPARSYVLLAACLDHQAALEISLDGVTRHGVLTHAYLEAIADLDGAPSWQAVYDRVQMNVRRRAPEQTPQLIGDLDRQVFGRALLPIQPTLIVTELDAANRRVRLDGGQTLALAVGSELAIYAPGETDFTRRLALATITEVSPFTSTAEIDQGAALDRIAPGSPAIVHRHARRWCVELVPPATAPHAAALEAVRAVIVTEASSVLAIATAGAPADGQVTIAADGRFAICDPRGAPLPYLEPRIAIDHVGAAHAVVGQLRRLARFHTVRAMTTPGALGRELDSQILLAPPGWDAERPAAATGGTPLQPIGDTYVVPSGTWIWLRLANRRPDRALYVALLDLTRTWEIERIVPPPDEPRGKSYETLTDRPRTFAFQMYTPIAEANDLMKLFITTEGVDFDRLGMLDAAPSPPSGVRRDVAPARTGSAPWAVREIRFRTVRGS